MTLDAPAAAWERMTGESAGPVKITLLEPSRLGPKQSELYAFKVEGLADLGPVIALRCHIGRAMAEWRLFADVLPMIGVPAPESFGWTLDADAEMAWHFIECLEPWVSAPGRTPDGGQVADWMGLLHVNGMQVSGAGVGMRDADHYGALLQRTIHDLEAQNSRGAYAACPGIVEQLLTRLSVLDVRWPAVHAELSAMPHSLVHGDLKPANIGVRMTSGKGVLVPFDWEYSGRGPIAVDLWAPSIRLHPELYLARLSRVERCSRASLDRMVAVGWVLRAIDAIGWLAMAPASRDEWHLAFWARRLEAAEGLW